MTALPPEPNNEGENQPAQETPGAQPGAAQVPPPPQQPTAPPQGGYQQPPAGGYQQAGYQQAGYQQPVGDPAGTITLNYWLSVFFTWLPALIFFMIEKDKGNQLANTFHRENLNFSLLRTILYVATWIIGMIPYIGWLIAILLWIGSVVLFVFHIMAAAKATTLYREGKAPEFVFNLPLVK